MKEVRGQAPRINVVSFGARDALAYQNFDSAPFVRLAKDTRTSENGVLYFPPGRFRFASNTTLDGAIELADGAVIVPDAGVTVTFSGTCDLEDSRVFDVSGGGLISFAGTPRLEVRSAWFGAPDDTAAVAGAIAAAATASLPIYPSGTTLAATALSKADTALAVPQTWESAKVLDFTRYQQNQQVAELAVVGAPTVAINAAHQLEVDAPWSLADRVTIPGMTFTEGTLRVRLVNGPFMIRLVDRTFAGRALWSTAGTNLEAGFVTSDMSPSSIGTTPLAGVAGDLIWIELQTGPMADGSGFKIRSWKDGDARPSSGTLGAWGAGSVGHESNSGIIALSSFSGSTAKYDRIEARDGGDGSIRAVSQASFIGRWFTRYEGARVGMATIRGGDKFRFYVRGTTSVSARYACTLGVVSNLVPFADVFVDGVRFGTVSFDAPFAGAFVSTVLASGLDPAKTTSIEVRIRGINEANGKWYFGAGLVIESLDVGMGVATPWPDTRPKMLFIGDSITEGIVGRSAVGGSMPVNSAGDVSWPILVSDMLGVSPVVNGFGGTALTHGGGGSVPQADANAFNYMLGRPIDGLAENIKYIVINQGTNDRGAGVTDSDFTVALTALIRKCLDSNPSVEVVYVMNPIQDMYTAATAAAVDAVGDTRVLFVDTHTWVVPLTDGLHPTLIGHQNMATYFAQVATGLQPGSPN